MNKVLSVVKVKMVKAEDAESDVGGKSAATVRRGARLRDKKVRCSWGQAGSFLARWL